MHAENTNLGHTLKQEISQSSSTGGHWSLGPQLCLAQSYQKVIFCSLSISKSINYGMLVIQWTRLWHAQHHRSRVYTHFHTFHMSILHWFCAISQSFCGCCNVIRLHCKQQASETSCLNNVHRKIFLECRTTNFKGKTEVIVCSQTITPKMIIQR